MREAQEVVSALGEHKVAGCECPVPAGGSAENGPGWLKMDSCDETSVVEVPVSVALGVAGG